MTGRGTEGDSDHGAAHPRADRGCPTPGAGGAGGWISWFAAMLQEVAGDVQALRKTMRRQTLAREEAESELRQLVAKLAAGQPLTLADPPEQAPPAKAAVPARAQIEALCRLDEAILHLQRTSGPNGQGPSGESAPRTSSEALAMLQVRVRNLQRSFGLQPVPGDGSPFDDRVHRVHAVCRRDDLPDGVVVETLLPGYSLNGQVVRPAEVVVNRRPQHASQEGR